jgi:hypothetical protein
MQMKSIASAIIELNFIEKDLTLTIDAKEENTLFDIGLEEQESECRFQIKEGCTYDYEFSNSEYMFKAKEYVQAHSRNYS